MISKRNRKAKRPQQARPGQLTIAPLPGVPRFPSGPGFPKKLQAVLRYCENGTTVSTLGVLANYAFRCNGLFDPNSSGAGHQPLYFDQFMAIYDHFTVMRSRIVVEGFVTVNSIVTLLVDDDGSVSTVMATAEEQPTAQHRTVASGATTPFRLTSEWDAVEYFGGDILDNDNLQGTAAADPVEQSLYVIQLQALDGATTTTLSWNVQIEYEVVFDELRTMTTS